MLGDMVVLVNTTITSNVSATGGALDVNILKVVNTIIANNSGAAPSNCFSTLGGIQLVDFGHNLEFPGTTCRFSVSSDRRVDPLLMELAFNGGRLRHALRPGSPAIDTDLHSAAAPASGAIGAVASPWGPGIGA